MAVPKQPPDVCLPMSLDAFVLNTVVCDQGQTFVAPITQPNYVSLRLSNSQIQHDLLPRIDLHNAQPSSANPRVALPSGANFRNTDPYNPTKGVDNATVIDRTRLGVYLHWSVPRGYRSASSQASKPPPKKNASGTVKQDDDTNPNPVFPLVPNRYLFVRIIRQCSPPAANIDKAAAWIIESDKLRKVSELDQSIDLQTDVTPFVAYQGDVDSNEQILDNQSQYFIGMKQPLQGWKETSSPGGKDPDRVRLTTMNTSNPLFADYAIHNPNVFSTKDNLEYKDSKGATQYLDSAVCDYIVVGWHSDGNDDPLNVSSSPTALKDRLRQFFCASPPNSDGVSDDLTSDSANLDLLNSRTSGRLLCHSAQYGVKFDLTTRPSSLGDAYAKLFTSDLDVEPVSVGTTPLDALLAFMQAHEQDLSVEDDVFSTTPGPNRPNPKTRGSEIAKPLMAMRELLYATEDDYDSRIKAADLIFSHNFARSPGGFTWHYDKKKSDDSGVMASAPPAIPSTDRDKDGKSETDYLNELNELQRAWDIAGRKLDQLRWALFAEFFKYVSDPSNGNEDVLDPSQSTAPVAPTTNLRLAIYQSRIPNLRREAILLVQQQSTLAKRIQDIQDGKKVVTRKLPNDPFFKRTDPTLCLAGIDGGWNPQFLNEVQTRFYGHLSGSGSSDTSIVHSLLTTIGSQLSPTGLSPTIVGLVTEASGGYQDSLKQFGHSVWSGQPFKPQFVEWEGTYYHIDRDQWMIGTTQSVLPSSNHTQVTYYNPNQLSSMPEARGDQRHISGRMLVLPQPSFALGAVVSQVLDTIPIVTTPPQPKPGEQPAPKPAFDLSNTNDRQDFLATVKNLKFVSGELTGLTDGLLTVAVGQHVKPNLRVQGKDVVPMQAAVAVGKKIGLTRDDFILMGGETSRTPYGTLVDFTRINLAPFKPVQHGQFALTKITIVDKFGQAISYPSPRRAPRAITNDPNIIPDYIHPCLSEQLIPSVLDNKHLNTVFTPEDTHDKNTASDYPMTPFIQLKPAINQDARINSVFLEKATDSSGLSMWKPCSDWENPIVGWLVVNYADSSLQFFTGDGTYYTALQFGGPTGTVRAKNWIPFEQPPQVVKTDKTDSTVRGLVSDQLDALIQKMVDPGSSTYLLAMWDMIRRAIPSMPFPPSDYAKYANAIIGKPLALVNVGWSLELAQPAYWRQFTLPSPQVITPPAQPRDVNDPLADVVDPDRIAAQAELEGYTFPIKIGDADRPFDGVVAYWNASNPEPTTDFSQIFTYFPDSSDDGDGVRVEITPDQYPELNPYFLPPPTTTDTTGSYTRAHTAKMKVRTLLVDPYTPMHVYSSILPIKSLQIPAWSLQDAMKNMTAFFTVGPLLLSQDVPRAYDPSRPLHPDSWIADQAKAVASNTKPLINLPIAGTKGMWNWLQPYRWAGPAASISTAAGATGAADTSTGTNSTSGTAVTTATTTMTTSTTTTKMTEEVKTHYNSFEVGKEDGILRLDPAPYTFVEGYLQLARPLVAPTAAGVPAGTVVSADGTK